MIDQPNQPLQPPEPAEAPKEPKEKKNPAEGRKSPLLHMLVCVYLIWTAFDVLEQKTLTPVEKISFFLIILIPLGLTVGMMALRNKLLEKSQYCGGNIFIFTSIASVLVGIAMHINLALAAGLLVLAILFFALGYNRIVNHSKPEATILTDMPEDAIRRFSGRERYERFAKCRLVHADPAALESAVAQGGAHLILVSDPDAVEKLRKQRLVAHCDGQNLEPLPLFCRDSANQWIGVHLNPLAMTISAKGWKENVSEGVMKPASLKDLTNDRYRGKIAVPDPRETRAGMIMLAGLCQNYGEEEGLEIMAALGRTAGTFYKNDADLPALLADKGKIVVVGLMHDILERQRLLKPDELVVPEGAGWETGMALIPTNTPDRALSDKLLSYLIGRPGNELYGVKARVVPAHDRALVCYGGMTMASMPLCAFFDLGKALREHDALLKKYRLAAGRSGG